MDIKPYNKYGLTYLEIGESTKININPMLNMKEIIRQHIFRLRKKYGVFIIVKYNKEIVTATRVTESEYYKYKPDKWGFNSLEIGEHILHEMKFPEDYLQLIRNMQSYYKKLNGKTFSVNKLTNGIKITRRS